MTAELLECEDWPAFKNGQGYGMKAVNGKAVGAHRLAYCNSNNVSLESIAGLCVLHKCDNPSCVNPEHLELGSRDTNNKQRASRGRSARDIPSKQVFSPAQVATIQKRFSPKRVGISAPDGVVALSREYGVDPNVIHKVIRGTYVCTREI